MRDSFNREVDYLRISVTDLCNLRCIYCMPQNGVTKLEHSLIISPERIKEIVDASVELGIKKIRLTGGEPLVRKGLIDIVKLIKQNPKIEEICLTTNGVGLSNVAKDLYEAGVNRLNISLDTLDENKYKYITRNGNLKDVLEGIKKAQEIGFNNIKINIVLIGGFNDDEIEEFARFAGKNSLTARFIELMPIGESVHFNKDNFISNNVVLSKLNNLEKVSDDGVSFLYKIKSTNGYIGLISPISKKFCETCSRIRLTSDGKIKPCLHSKAEIDLNGLSGIELINKIKEAILAKPKEHHLESGHSESLRDMNKIGG